MTVALQVLCRTETAGIVSDISFEIFNVFVELL